MAQKMPVFTVNLTTVSYDHEWYTVVTKFNYEKKYAGDVISGLANVGLSDDIIDIVVPIRETEVSVETRAGNIRKKVKVEKIYPGYVFVKARMNARVWSYLRNTTGAATILATGGVPISMTDTDMLKVKEACGLLEKEKEVQKEQRRRKIEELRVLYKTGIKVTISEGIFSGYDARIVSADFQRQKINVALDLNGVNVEVHMDNLKLY